MMSPKHRYGAAASISLSRRPDEPVSIVGLYGEVDLRVHTAVGEGEVGRTLESTGLDRVFT